MIFVRPTILCLALTATVPYSLAETPQSYTRSAEKDAPRPVVDVTDLGWLIGHWEGPAIDGAPAQESWARPLGGMMHGTFVQGDGKGGVMFSEHMQIAPDGKSIVLRLKHFNADLTGWEEKDKFVAFPLIARDRDALYFNGLTIRRDGRDRLFVAVRMKPADGKRNELVFRFQRAGR